MNKNFKHTIAFIITVLFLIATPVLAEPFTYQWKDIPDRTWTGRWFWANRLQDWRVDSGRLECIEIREEKPLRTLHVLPVELTDTNGSLNMSVHLGMLKGQNDPSPKALAGFLIGAGADIDYRSAALIHSSPGSKGGLIACVTSQGVLQFRDMTAKGFPVLVASEETVPLEETGLLLSVTTRGDDLELSAKNPASGKTPVTIRTGIDHRTLKGNIALLSNPGTGKGTRGFWFDELSIDGEKIAVHSERTCGPILSTQHTLSKNIMKLSAQMMPLGNDESQTVILEGKSGETWKQIAAAEWVRPSYTALFRIENWDSTKDHDCRVAYNDEAVRKSDSNDHYEVLIKHDPVEKDVTTIAAFTGNHNNRRGIEGGFYDWSQSVWFPHTDITRHVAEHNPDMLFFSGDQIYEGESPTSVDVKFLKLDYLYKWYLWCWAYRDLTREIVSVCVPDDHDVFQGNLWGQNGRKADNMDFGGYVHPVDFVKQTERTQTCHLPDPYDPTPVEQGIGVYYTSLDYGGISYAVLEDRKFKTGYKSEEALSGDPTRIQLLGERQLDFLRDWAADWQPGIEMKCVLSQTIFGCLHTGWDKTAYRKGPPSDDHDTNGWPVHGRNKALREIRKGFGFMIGGDQHLATIVHHGIEEFDDAGWSFCVPSVANFYPRSWLPDVPAEKPLEGLPEYTGSYYDGFHNKVTLWAAANPPKETTGIQPAALHDRSPGYGVVHFNKKDRTIRMECWPRYADPKRDELQYQGWPKTIGMLDNYGKEPVAWLPKIEVNGFDKPVLQIIDQLYGDIVYTLRIPGHSFRPWVFREGLYTLRIGQPGTDRLKVLNDLKASSDKSNDVITVDFAANESTRDK